MPREQEFPTARVQMTWNDFVGSHFQLTLQLPEDRPREDLVMAGTRAFATFHILSTSWLSSEHPPEELKFATFDACSVASR
jgi:hypothetical protein